MFVTLLLICLPGQLALQCYYCDTINNVSCPAGDRHIHTDGLQGILTDIKEIFKSSSDFPLQPGQIFRTPVDPAIRQGDLLGLYSQCVTVSVLGGLLEQNIYPGETHCHPVFIRDLQISLKQRRIFSK